MMKVGRNHLIELCEKYLIDEIQKNDLITFAQICIIGDEMDWEENDKIFYETIFEWHNEDINYPINKMNIKLWKNRLQNNIDELEIHNYWNVHIEKQKFICEKYGSNWNPINEKLNIGISENLELEALNGLRHKTKKGEVCWFIWSGDYSEDPNFFQPICAEHLMHKKPKLIDYLGLDHGFRFLVTADGYEDVWFDEKLL